MKAVREETARIIRGNNRRYTAAVVFSFLSCRAPESIKIQASNAQNGSVPDQIVYPYLSHLEDRFFTRSMMRGYLFPSPENKHKDGRLHPVKNRAYSRIGYIGAKADIHGSVSDTITLYMPSIELRKITLKTNPDRIIQQALITAKTKTGQPLAHYQIENNRADTLSFDLPAQNAAILELHIIKHTPNKRIWIIAFYPGFEFSISEKDIISIKTKKKKTENKEGSIGRLYISSIDMVLNNITRLYDNKNSKSPIAGYLNTNAICSARLLLKQPDSYKPFFVDLGTFFVMTIQNNEKDATVTIKAQDYIGVNKNTYLTLGIQEQTNAFACFAKIANALSLSTTRIDTALKRIRLKRMPLNGTVSSLLNALCLLTNAFCACDETGSALIATETLSRHAALRYPVRHFLLNEYSGGKQGAAAQNTPNVINLSYSQYEYEDEYHIGSKDVILYQRIKKQSFPDTYKNVPYGMYPVGGGLEPSFTKRYILPTTFAAIELSDPFIPRAFEYRIIYQYDDAGKATKAEISLWNFVDKNEGEQLTICIMVKEKPDHILLKAEQITVPKMPQDYQIPDKHEVFNQGDAAAVESHNALNKPLEYKIEMKDCVNIAHVEIANLFLKSQFEFSYRMTALGIHLKIWNYFPHHPQTVTVNIYGNRLVAGKEKKTITARNEDDIQRNGEIIKNIEVGPLASDTVALEVLKKMAHFYRHFSTDTSIQTWADPRLSLYDLVAFKSLRGYGFTQGVIDEIEMEYKGYLTQKLKLKQTKKHSRDSRLFLGMVFNDRPVISKRGTDYA